jgi:DNA repair protein RecO (recombination protein O)
MINNFSTRGIIISKIKFKETSYILKVFTKNYGLISIIVHGARKQNSRFIGFFNILNELDFSLSKSANSEIYVIKDVDFIRFFLSDVKYNFQPYYFIVCELVNQLLADEYNKIYSLIIKYFEFLSKKSIPRIFIFWRFLSKFMLILGNPVLFEKCQICSKHLDLHIYYFQRESYFLCQYCATKVSYTNKVSRESALILKNFKNLSNFETAVSEKTIKEINNLFLAHIRTHFHQDFNLKLLNELR